ncbi:MAG: hypothetical protein U9R79_02865 [Armatimonadota bacterium]|nr:hypothetical protein [Armatimonadota bacterium]
MNIIQGLWQRLRQADYTWAWLLIVLGAGLFCLREHLRYADHRREAALRQIEHEKRRNTIQVVDRSQSPAKGAGWKTDAQRKASWDEVWEGQWVRWTGTVVQVSGRATAGDPYTVYMRCSPTTSLSDTRFEVDRATALSLSKGETITVEGTLADHGVFGYKLDNAHVSRAGRREASP